MKLSKKVKMYVTPNGKTHIGTFDTDLQEFNDYLSCTGLISEDHAGDGALETLISHNLTCSECASKLKKAAKKLNNLIK